MAQSYRDNDVTVYDDDRVARPVRRISWGAVLAGTLIALMILLLINLLGLGLGLESINPATEADPLAGVGTGLSITVIIANLLALFFGGWAAGRLAGNPRTTEGVLHGILVWGLLTLLTFWLLTTAAGRLVSGAASAVGQGLSLVGQGVSAVAPDAAAAVENALSAQGVSLQSVRQEAQGLFSDVGAVTGGAVTGGGIAGVDVVEGEGSVQETAADAAQNVESTAQDIAQNPQAASAEIDQLFNQLTASGESLADSANRQDLVEALVANTNLTQAEAEARVDNWISTLQDADVNVQGARQDLEQAAQNASDALGRAALWAFVGLLVGALIAAIGAAVGSPSNPRQARRA